MHTCLLALDTRRFAKASSADILARSRANLHQRKPWSALNTSRNRRCIQKNGRRWKNRSNLDVLKDGIARVTPAYQGSRFFSCSTSTGSRSPAPCDGTRESRSPLPSACVGDLAPVSRPSRSPDARLRGGWSVHNCLIILLEVPSQPPHSPSERYSLAPAGLPHGLKRRMNSAISRHLNIHLLDLLRLLDSLKWGVSGVVVRG
jgi:hypothetical protein